MDQPTNLPMMLKMMMLIVDDSEFWNDIINDIFYLGFDDSFDLATLGRMDQPPNSPMMLKMMILMRMILIMVILVIYFIWVLMMVLISHF